MDDDAIIVVNNNNSQIGNVRWNFYTHSMDKAKNWITHCDGTIDSLEGFYALSPFIERIDSSDPASEVKKIIKVRFSLFLEDCYPDWKLSYLSDGCRWMMDKRSSNASIKQVLEEDDVSDNNSDYPNSNFPKIWYVTCEWLLSLSEADVNYFQVAGVMCKYSINLETKKTSGSQIAIWLKQTSEIDSNLEFLGLWIEQLEYARCLPRNDNSKFSLCGLSKFGRMAVVYS